MNDTVLRLVTDNKLVIPRETERPVLRIVKSKCRAKEPLDSLVHRHTYRGFAVEVWQTREIVGTQKPSYYTLRFNTAVTKRYPRASREEGFSTVAQALSFTEHQIDRRRKVLDDPRYQRRRRIKSERRLAIPGEAAIIDYITGGVAPDLPARIMDAFAESQAVNGGYL